MRWLLLCVTVQALSLPNPITFFEHNGYLGPFDLFTEQEALQIQHEIRYCSAPANSAAAFWAKNRLFQDPNIVAIGRRAELLDLVEMFLGPDLLLWGIELVTKRGGASHRWHVDIEHANWEGVTVWLPLCNASHKSTLRFIPGSHRQNSLPQMLHDPNNDEQVLAAARERDPEAKIVSLDIHPGQFVLFAGRLWHHSINETAQTRHALIF